MNAIEAGLYTALTGSAPLIAKLGGTAIWNQVIPQGESLPAVVFNYAGGGEENLTTVRMVNTPYTVKAVSETSLQHAGEIAVLIDTALHGQTLTIAGWTNFWLARESLIRYIETAADGKQYYHCGATYRIRASKD